MVMLLCKLLLVLYVHISTPQVSLVDGIDAFKPFWVLEPSNSDSTGKGSPVTRQQINPHKLGEKTAFEFTPHTHIIIMLLVLCLKQL